MGQTFIPSLLLSILAGFWLYTKHIRPRVAATQSAVVVTVGIVIVLTLLLASIAAVVIPE